MRSIQTDRVSRCGKFFGIAVVSCVCLALFLAPAAYARSQYLTDWMFFYEGWTTLGTTYGCGVCHVPNSTDYSQFNPYGAAMRPCVAAGGLVDDCALLIEDIDSDGDVWLNFDEIVYNRHPGIPDPYVEPPCAGEDPDLDGFCSLGGSTCACGSTQSCDDNCMFIYNPLQEDCDCDGIGNPCDVDDDGDGYDVISAPPLWDCNDSCLDANGDGVPDGYLINPGRPEICGNAVDENCDTIVEPTGPDLDGDGVPECRDNCPGMLNPDQFDTDGDGIGDLCDPTPCGKDTDGDGIGDMCDSDIDGDGLLNANDPVESRAPNGDVNGDGQVDVADVLLAERIAAGNWIPDEVSKHMADVAPYLSGGIPDKVIRITDVLRISRMAGMGN